MNHPLSNRFLALLGATALLLLPPASALMAEDGKTKGARKVAALIVQRDEVVADKLAPLREQYVAGLEKFRLDWVAADRIDDALAALELNASLEEHSSFDLPPGKLDTLPTELRRVVNAWNSARAGYLKESTVAVREKIASLRAQAVVDGDLDAAQELDRHLTLLLPGSDAPPMAPLFGEAGGPEYLPAAWVWGSGGTLQLLPDGIAVHSRWRGQQGSWEWTRHRRIALTNPINNEVSEIQLNKDGSGEVFDPAGRSTSLTPLDEAP